MLGDGLTSDAVRVTRQGNHAVLAFAGEEGSVKLVDALYGGGWGVEEVQFADGVVWGRTELLNAVIA